MTETDLAAPIDVSEAAIAELVDIFYTRVRRDSRLGPVFYYALGDSEVAWDAHLARLRDFWSSISRRSGRYHGDPFTAHMDLPGMTPELFDHWLGMFGTVCDEVFAPDIAAFFRSKSERIARSLRIGLFERLPAARAAAAAAG